METSGFRPESHVPQQSRREKLRVHPTLASSHHLDNLPNHLEPFSIHQELNPDVVQVRNVRHANLLYDPGMMPLEMLDFSRNNPHVLSSHRSSMVAGGDGSSGEQMSFGNWRSVNNNHPQQSFDWVLQNPILANPIYQSSLEDVVTSSTRNQQELQTGNELVLLPSYVNQSETTLRFDNPGSWMDREVENQNLQGLSLSLSSNPASNLPIDQQDLETRKSSSIVPKPSIISKGCGKSLQDIVGISNPSASYRSTSGPLGPFTGYATILKSSKFLKPAQQLLEEFICGSKLVKTSEFSGDGISASVSASASGDGVNGIESEVLGKGNNSCGSSSTFYGSKEISGDCGVGSISFESYRPEQHHKKAKLLYMQEEVTRRYKQYRQQIEMVVSSFETVAGLSAATPYISLALKAVTKHFRCLKSVIADQLKHTRKELGEDLLSPTTGSSSKGGDTSTGSRLKYVDQSSFQKLKSGGVDHMAFSEPQQHIWRPQRGLPERSVAILRAWLFEHFLHPYPTDTDKHMLATQTGLTRNQVSNWFINARVRVWKPMVEEIHMLETKGTAEVDQIQRDGNNAATEGTRTNMDDQISSKFGMSLMKNKQLEFSGTSFAVGNRDGPSGSEQQSQEKRLRLECQVPTSIAGAFVGFVPYQHRNGLDVWSRINDIGSQAWPGKSSTTMLSTSGGSP
ncbi:hypothetical protein UlMin_028906 [Ulmus minor]